MHPRAACYLCACICFLSFGCSGSESTEGAAAQAGAGSKDTGGVLVDSNTAIGDIAAGINDAGAGPMDGVSSAIDGGLSTADVLSESDVGKGGKDAEGLQCPGGFGCSCDDNTDCDAGACFDGPGGRVCSKACSETCPTGYVCKGVGEGDLFYLCVPNWTSLCSPCANNADCKTQAGGAVCLSRGDLGRYCGAPCLKDAECPAGYVCTDAFDQEANTTTKQCTLKDKTAECECNKWAQLAAKSTTCTKANAVGICKGTRACSAKGLSGCDAAVATQEVCDGADNDCNGTTDVLAFGAVCFVVATLPNGVTASCSGKPLCDKGQEVCVGATKPGLDVCDGVDNDCNGKTDDNACDDDDACTSNKCDAKTAKCSNLINVTCDDGNQCTTDACDKATGTCVYTAMAVGTSCDDDDACTIGDVCVAGGQAAVCQPGSVTKICDDGNLCTDDSCSADKGCVVLPNTVTQACYTGDKGTLGVGACKGGVQSCANGVLLGACAGQVLPANSEQCDAIDDNCNGVTDDGCKVTSVVGRFASVAGEVGASKKRVRLLVGSETALTATTSGAKHQVSFDWLHKLQALLSGK